MKKSYYFPHDTNAFLDPKIRYIITEYGVWSYALFWVIIEMMSSQRDFKLKYKGLAESIYPLLQGKPLKVNGENGIATLTDWNNKQISCDMKFIYEIPINLIEATLEACLEVGLFVLEPDGKIHSISLDERMSEIQRKSELKSEIGRIGGLKSGLIRAKKSILSKQNEAEVEPSFEANEQNKIKENKIKENKTIDILDSNSIISKVSSIDLELSNIFVSHIKENLPTFKEPDINKWAEEIERIHRIDQRPYDLIKAVIIWSQQHSFWRKNILSPAKLRKQFDRLCIEAKTDIDNKRPVKI